MATAETLLTTLVAPQYAGDSRVTLALEVAALQVDLTCFEGTSAIAQAYLAAHTLLMSDRATQAGTSGVAPVGAAISVRTGDLAVGYGTGGYAFQAAWYGDAGLMATPYGQEFIRLRGQTECAVPFWGTG